MALIRLRHIISGGILELSETEAAAVLVHPWFSQWYVPDVGVWPPEYMEQDDTPPQQLSEWIVTTDGYIVNG